VIELLIVLLISGNAYQYIENSNLENELATVKEANKTNANTIGNFSASLKGCSDKLSNWSNKESAWEVERESSAERLQELERAIDSSDWGDCRIPDNLEF